MKANAWHHRADAVSSVVALIGVGKTYYAFILSPFFPFLSQGKFATFFHHLCQQFNDASNYIV